MLDTSPFLVAPDSRVDLTTIDTRATPGFEGDKHRGKEIHRSLAKRTEELQEILYAQGRRRLLVVLQATDTGGKDSTIRRVFEGVNPQGVDVASFRQPSESELARDYLWRAHARVPANGRITIFNRSHYEDVLVVRVRELVPPDVWGRRYGHINAFEKMLADEGTRIIKFFLHISKDEQRERLEKRLDDPTKHWKFSLGDLEERKRWDHYQQAFTDMLERTSTAWAPWYVVPADRKWYRDLVVSSVLIETLEDMDLHYPEPAEDLSGVEIT